MKSFLFLLLAVLISAGGFWKIYSQENTPTNIVQSEVFLVPDLVKKSTNLRSIIISSAQQKTTLLSNDGMHWQVHEKYGFPADVSRIRELLFNLSEARRLEQKTDDVQRMQAMNLNPEKATHVELQATNEKILDIFLGNSKNNNSYIRMANEKFSYRVSNVLVANANPALWLAPEFISLEAHQIKSLKFTAENDEEFSLLRDEKSKIISLEKTPKGREVITAKLEESFKALDNLVVVDVLSSLKLKDVVPQSSVVITGFSGIEINIQFFNLEKSWLTISASYNPEDKSIAASFATIAEINRINQSYKNWAFQIAPQREALLKRKIEDMLTKEDE